MSSLALIASGMSGGMAACLVLRFVWAAVAGQSRAVAVWRAPSAMNELLYVSTHAAIGAGVGLLFWLSWGFTAMAGWSWWQQGLGFGLLNALVFGVVPLLIVRSLLSCTGIVYWLLSSEILVTCVAASLASSWSWKQAF